MAWRSKDATVLLVDVGRSMLEPVAQSSGGKITKADLALRIARNFVQQKLLFTPKHEVGIIFIGTAETRNALSEDGYQSVVVEHRGAVDVPDVDALRPLTDPPAGGAEPDAVNGLIVALDLLIKRTAEQKYNKTIRLLTDTASLAAEDPDMLECVKQLEATGTKLQVSLVGVADAGAWGPLAAGSPSVELVPLSRLAGECSLCVKPVEQRAKVRLSLVISPCMQIPVGVYSKTTRAVFPALKKCSKLAAGASAEHQKKDSVITERTTYVADDPDGEEVKAEDRIKGHKYGQSIVPMSEYDEAALMYQCERTLTTLGFAPAGSVDPQSSIHHVEEVAADKGDLWAHHAFESLVASMVAKKSVLIARYCFRTNAQPRMVALIPFQGRQDQASSLCLQYLPFFEDLREWSCASLPAPSPEQRDAVSALVDAMDLEAAAAAMKGDPELLVPEDTHNPSLARFYRFLCQRAVSPAAKVPAPGPEDWSLEPPAHVEGRLAKAKVAERLLAKFRLEKVEKAAGKRTKRFWREAIAQKRKEAMMGEVDTKRIKVDAATKKEEKEEKVKDEDSQHAPDGAAAGMAAAVGLPPRVHIGSVHPERDFERWLAHRVGGVDAVNTAIEQMCGVIERFADEGEEFHGKALSCLSVLRQGCVREGEAAAYNEFARRLQSATAKRRALFWEQAREAAFGLVTDAEVATSAVTAEEARAFLAGEDFVSHLPSAGSGAPAAARLSERDLEDMIE